MILSTLLPHNSRSLYYAVLLTVTLLAVIQQQKGWVTSQITAPDGRVTQSPGDGMGEVTNGDLFPGDGSQQTTTAAPWPVLPGEGDMGTTEMPTGEGAVTDQPPIKEETTPPIGGDFTTQSTVGVNNTNLPPIGGNSNQPPVGGNSTEMPPMGGNSTNQPPVGENSTEMPPIGGDLTTQPPEVVGTTNQAPVEGNNETAASSPTAPSPTDPFPTGGNDDTTDNPNPGAQGGDENGCVPVHGVTSLTLLLGLASSIYLYIF